MKKNLLITTFSIILLTVFILPFTVHAATEVTNLKEAVEEEIALFGEAEEYADQVEELKSYDLSNYKDDDSKVNVYIFRGSTCSHCFDAIKYFAKLYGEEGKYFNVKTYEVWNNSDNKDTMDDVAKKLGSETGGVPYIVIGKKAWNGFSESMADEIVSVIKSEYKKDKANRYDVLSNAKEKTNYTSDIVAVLIIIVIAVGIVCAVIFTRKETNNEEDVVKEEKKEEPVKKTPAKKTTATKKATTTKKAATKKTTTKKATSKKKTTTKKSTSKKTK